MSKLFRSSKSLRKGESGFSSYLDLPLLRFPLISRMRSISTNFLSALMAVGRDTPLQSAREEMVDKSGQMGVPVIDIDGTVIVGFDAGAINDALAA